MYFNPQTQYPSNQRCYRLQTAQLAGKCYRLRYNWVHCTG